MRFAHGRNLFAVAVVSLSLGLGEIRAQTIQPAVASKPVMAPPQSANGPLAKSIVVWDADLKTIDVHEGDEQGHLAFNFTNVSSDPVVILNANAGCHCTTLQLPALPWTIPPGSSGTIGVTIDLRGKTGSLYKTISVSADKGIKSLTFRVNILPVPMPQVTEADRASMLQAARADRQAVFKADCIDCHVKRGQGKYGKQLYDADCGICHEGERRATMVPDLHALKVATNQDFWRTWIAHGKPGGLMPAFASSEGGPLSETQINSLCLYLGYAIHSPTAP